MRRRLGIVAAIGATFAALAGGSVGVLSASAAPQDKSDMAICHRTNSETNPYNKITPATEGILNGHFEQHKGPIFEPGLKDQGIEGGDIIPPIPGHPEGLNWPEGESTLNNNCVPPNLPPPPGPPGPPGEEAAPPGPAAAPPGPAAAPPGPAAPAAPRAPAAVRVVPRVTG